MLKKILTYGSLALAMCGGVVFSRAQEAGAKVDAASQAKVPGAADAKVDDNFEVLTRGPIHEAYATQYQTGAVAGVTIDKEPPAAIDEIPPPAKPEGEGVTWIPGYWGWDAEKSDFLWVSGTYRNAPPGQRWTPGYWAKVGTGYQWMSGFWLDANTTSLNYYSPPPQSLERGPSSPAPGNDYFYAPGSYVPQREKYAWQPGYWVPYQANYVWTPARNIATPGGYIYTPGYWDYRLDQRGALFAPVRVNAAANVNANTNLQLTPSTIIPFSVLQYHLFAPAKSNNYLFGNYYGDTYVSHGIQPWYANQYVKGINDPLFGYYNWAYAKSGANYAKTLAGWNGYYTANAALRPAATLAAQLDVARTQASVKTITSSLIGVPLLGANVDGNAGAALPAGFVKLNATEQASLKTSLQDLRVLADNRVKLETSAIGAAHVGAAANTALQVAATPLALPKMAVPVVQSVPAAPAQLVRRAGATVGGVGQAAGGAVRGATGAIPNVLPGVLPGGQPGGLIPNVLPPSLPGGGLLPGVLPGGPGGGEGSGGGGLLPKIP